MPLMPGGPPLPSLPPGVGGPPGMPPPPSMGPPPGMGAPPGMGGGMGMPAPPPFPSIDPGQVAPALGGIRDMQMQDQAQLQTLQQGVLDMLVQAMKTEPNPAGQAAMTAPGYPTPPEEAIV